MRGSVVVVLQHQMHMALRLDTRAPRRPSRRANPARDRVDRVEAQAVEAIFHQPVERVVDEELAHFAAAEIDRRTPRRVDVVAEERRRVAREIVPVRAEMVVDDVEKHHQAVAVRGIDQRLQFVGRAVAASGAYGSTPS